MSVRSGTDDTDVVGVLDGGQDSGGQGDLGHGLADVNDVDTCRGGEERKKKGLSIDAGEGVNTAGWLGGQGVCEVHEGVVILAFVQGIIVSPE